MAVARTTRSQAETVQCPKCYAREGTLCVGARGGPYSDPLRVVFLCRKHHDAYDSHTLDLLPELERYHRAELARAVQIFGLVATLERVTGHKWSPGAAHHHYETPRVQEGI
jgi:hypothetical protein